MSAYVTSRETDSRASHLYVVLNTKSGSCDVDVTRSLLEKHLTVDGAICRVHEPTPENSASLVDHIREAIAAGAGLVVAAGGDGTVSAVADALAGVDANVPLGIVPLGTANVLAGELGIPLDLDAACSLIGGPHAVARIDTMVIGGKHFLTQVGVGLDALMIRDTSTAGKKRYGRAAYLWTALTRFAGFQPRRFILTVDGQTTRPKASQVLIANSGTLGQKPFRWGENIKPDDGVLDVCVIRARTWADFVSLGWHVLRGKHRLSRNVTYLTARREVTIDAKFPLPVQADGEIVGETPVNVRLAPGSVKVVVPARVAE